MAGKRKKEKNSQQLRQRLAGLGLMGVGAFFLISLILTWWDIATPESIGLVGGFAARSLLGLFGQGGIFLPLVLLFWGLSLLFGWGNRQDRTINGLGILILMTGLLGLFGVESVRTLSLRDAALLGLDGAGGGVTGAVIAWSAHRVLGRIGAYIALGVLAAAGAVMLIEGLDFRFFRRLFAGLAAAVRRGMECRKERRQRKASQRPAKPEPHRQQEVQEKTSPRIHQPEEFDDRSYQSVKTVLMDEELGRAGRKPGSRPAGKTAAGEPARTESPEPGETEKTEEMLERQMELCLDPQPASRKSRKWVYPPLSLLSRRTGPDTPMTEAEITRTARLLEETLEGFGVKLKIDEVSCGPAVTRYEAKLAPGVKVSKILRLSDDLALSLATSNIRIEAPIPGKAAIGIEVPNAHVADVALREIMADPGFGKSDNVLGIALGKDIAGGIVTADLARMPHLLVAGATGSGKSVCMNTLICSLLFRYSPEELKMLMVDPKKVELNNYNDIPHLVAPVVTDPKKAATALRWMTAEMENRYSLFAAQGVKDIEGYNRKMASPAGAGSEGGPPLPFIAIFIDELSDLMMVAPADVEDSICRLAQMARAAGMHLVIATQRPSVNVITGLIKANVPSRIAFAVSSQVDSRTILDGAGAEKLLGRGDMLFSPVGLNKPKRVQGAFISDGDVLKVVDHLKKQGQPEYLQGVEVLDREVPEDEESAGMEETDELLPEAAAMILETGQASISMVQRRLKVGYARAARIIDQLEEKNVVGGFEGSKPRQVLIGWDQYHLLFGQEDGSGDD